MAFFRPVKTPETPRSYLPKLAEPPSAEEQREAKIVPRYVEIPALREHGFGPRNLFWGVATLILALLLLVAALFFAGPKATLSLATSLLTFTALFVLSRMHVFRQRNGGFLALAVVCLLGTLMPLLETGFEKLKYVEFHTVGGTTGVASTSAGDTQVLTQAFALSAPQGPGKQVKVLKDSRVTIADRNYLIKAGDLFPYIESKGDEATFAVRDLQVSLPTKVVEVIDPTAIAQGVTGRSSAPAATAAQAAPATPPAVAVGAEDPAATPPLTQEQLAAITKSAQAEAIRRYPALGIKDSRENHIYVSAFQQIREKGNTEFFTNPEWPIQLAELLATREGWGRGNGPAPVLDAPRGVIEDDAPVTAPVPRQSVSDGSEEKDANSTSELPPLDKLDAGDEAPQAPPADR